MKKLGVASAAMAMKAVRDVRAEHGPHGPLRLCGPRALHASLRPSAWSGERWWVVGLLGDITRDGDKAGALRRLIVEEVA